MKIPVSSHPCHKIVMQIFRINEIEFLFNSSLASKQIQVGLLDLQSQE